MTFDRWSGFLLGIAVEGGLALLAQLVAWLFDLPLWETVRWDWPALAWGIVASLPMFLAFWVVVRWPVGPLATIKQISEDFIRPLFASAGVWQLALLSLAAGIGEEALFRGTFQGLLGRWLGAVPGLLLASLLFGLLHPLTPTYIALAALLGFYLGCWWNATDNLLVVIVAHSLYDFVALVYLVRRPGDPGRAAS